MNNSYRSLLSSIFFLFVFSNLFSQQCDDFFSNENQQIDLSTGQLEAGGDEILGTTTETNNSDCAIAMVNNDNGQPWARYHLELRLSDFGLSPGDELYIGIDGKNDSGFGRIEVNKDDKANSAIISKNFTNIWSRVEGTFIIPEVETLDIWLFSNYGLNTPGLVFYDNFLIEKVESFRPFITTWKTDNSGVSENNEISIPTMPGEAYDYRVDWGDGTISTNVTGNITHTYEIPGTYTVSIFGDFSSIFFNGVMEFENDKAKLLSIDQWGDINWSTMKSAFDGCINLKMLASDVPNLSNVNNLGNMFHSCTSLEDNITWNNWETGNINKMHGMFFFSSFNFNISSWDVSKVDDFRNMFTFSPFNQSIGNWDVGAVKNMNEMFKNSPFNQDISNWNVSIVEAMGGMFSESPFNQDISTWNVESVKNMHSMFSNSAFDQNISEWNVSNLTDARFMFANAGLSSENYDVLLLGWSRNPNLKSGVDFNAGNSHYCVAVEARQKLINDFGWMITDGGEKCPIDFTNAFISTWKTDNPGVSEPNQITIPTNEYQIYNYTVDWGDGTTTENITESITHTYDFAGTYTVSIVGQFPQIYFNNYYNSISDSKKILLVNQWGDNQWRSMNNAFSGCENLDVVATDIPDFSFVSNMNGMFLGAKSLIFNTSINDWDVLNVQDMGNMFSYASVFNQDIGTWNTSSVVFMWGMFSEAKMFNQNIGNWDTSHVFYIDNMFSGAEQFNQDIGDWNLENVIEMGGMFYNARSFNQDISRWNVSKVRNTGSMFYFASAFNQDLSQWNISNVEYMYNMFDYSGLSTENYDTALIAWSQLPALKNDVSLGAEQTGFCESESARQLLINTYNWTINDKGLARNCGIGEQTAFVTTWKTDNSGVSNDNQITIPTYTSQSWEEELVYNYTIDWGDGTNDTNVTGDITHTYDVPGIYTVSIIGDFPRISFADFGNQKDNEKILSIEQWGNFGWTSMEGAFIGCTNLDLTATDSPNLTWVESISQMFYGCSSLIGNETISQWDTQGIRDMYGVFYNAKLFNQPIDSWNVGDVRTFFDMFNGASQFNQPLASWDLKNAYGISGMFNSTMFNQDISNWDVSNVQYMSEMFKDNTSFNQDISGWNVSNVENMYGMFNNATSFNQDISSWNVSKVRDMSNMFYSATTFNQNLGSWDIKAVIYLYSIFDFSGISLENYDNTLIGWSSLPTLKKDVHFGAVDKYFCESTQARANIIAIYNWTFEDAGKSEDCTASAFRPFVTTWNTTLLDNPTNEITIPSHSTGTSGNTYVYDYTVDWGDGTTDTNVTGNITHNYNISGEYKVSISGSFPQIVLENSETNSSLLQSIDQWGDVEWSSMQGAFAGCTNLDVLAKDIPILTNVTNAENMFANCSSLIGNQSFDKWNVSNLQNASGMFNGTPIFNQILSNWDTSQITDMSAMFRGSGFKNSLGTWDVSKVTSMDQMFAGSAMTSVNYDNTLIGWSRLQNLQPNLNFDAGLSTFCLGEEAKQSIVDTYSWSIVDNGKLCPEQNAFVTTWKTDNIGKSNDNQISIPILGGPYTIDWGDGTIDTDSYGEQVHTYEKPGVYTVSVLGDIYSLNFNSYYGNESNSEISKILEVNQWGDVNWAYVDQAFSGCTNLDVVATDIFDLSNVTTMRNMFSSCHSLKGNESFNLWDTSNITDLTQTFNSCENFNANISNWDVSKVTSMFNLFSNNLLFNQDISNWNVSSTTDLSFMFSNAISFNQKIGGWDVSNVTQMPAMFQNTNFNQDISNWNVSNVENMSYMFGSSKVFNQDISNWDVSNVTEMVYMFGWSIFNQDLGSWNVSKVENMESIFVNSSLSIDNYDKILIGWSQLGNLQDNVKLGASQNYCAAKDARNYLIDTYGWVIYDNGLDDNCDVIAPTLVSFSPMGNDIEISEELVLSATFSEPIQWQENPAPIVIYDITNNVVFESFDTSSGSVSFTDNAMQIISGQEFSPNTNYEVQMGPSSLQDSNGNAYEGLVYGTWSFTTAYPICVLAINEQPQGIDVCEMETTLEFSVSATGTGTLSYNWQTLGNGLTEWTDVEIENGNASLMINSLFQLENNGQQYRVQVTDDQGTLETIDDCTLLSSVAILKVNSKPIVSFIAPNDIEVRAGIQHNLEGGLPTGGVYSGLGVTDNETGTSYSFDPSLAGVGNHILTYTYTNEYGCIASATDNIYVDQGVISCPDNLENENSSMVLSQGTRALGVDTVVGITTDANNSNCALEVSNLDNNQPWGAYRISIRLADYGLVAGNELFVGVDGKSLTGTARLEINRNNSPNSSLGSMTFGSDWGGYETTFIIPSGLTTIDLWFFSNYGQNTPGIALYDNLTVINMSDTGGNLAPVANAGNDINLEDTDLDNTENITLNASNSTDLDGEIISYVWSENGIEIANGVNPIVNLSIGAHTLILTVTDNEGATNTDTVLVSISQPNTTSCSDDLINENPSIVLSSGTIALGVDSVTGTTTDTNNSNCALMVTNIDSGQPWGAYRIEIRLADYNITAGDELFIGVDGKSVTGTARLEINRNNAANAAMGSKTFGNSWSRYETTFIVPTGITTLNLWFFSNYAQQNAGSAVYDNLEVRNLSSSSSGKSIQETKPLNDLTIYPNPANIETTLSFKQPTTVGTIQVFDVTGRLVHTIKGGLIDQKGTPVNVQEMPQGVYFVKTIDASGVEFQQQMLIQRQ